MLGLDAVGVSVTDGACSHRGISSVADATVTII